jgi:predicted patatin/cPLA2 family phospholipase
MKIGRKALVVEGGATRGAFSCGVLDTFLEENFSPFDSFWGVSAGATNLAGYVAKMPGRSYKIYRDYLTRSEFLTPFRFLLGGDLMDLDWLWDITVKELPFSFATLEQDPRPLLLAVTRLDNGLPEYHPVGRGTLTETLKASSALPLFYRSGVQLGSADYVDGGVADAIPVEEAIARGAEEIMVLRSRPVDYRKNGKSAALTRVMFRKTPGIIAPLLSRAKRYNRAVELLRNPPEGIRIVEICLPGELHIGRFTRDRGLVAECYQAGLEAGHEAIEQWGQQALYRADAS